MCVDVNILFYSYIIEIKVCIDLFILTIYGERERERERERKRERERERERERDSIIRIDLYVVYM